MTRNLLLSAASVFALVSSSALAADAIPSYVTAAVHDPGRVPEDVKRDAARHPAELVAFSGMKPGDKVVDFWPGGGYYTRIFAPLVGEKGHVYSVVPYTLDKMPQFAMDEAAKNGGPSPRRGIDNALAIENIAKYKNVTALWEILGQFGGQFSLPEQVDVVWTSENYHDMKNIGVNASATGAAENTKALDMVGVDKAIFASLKPGGVFVVSDHAAAKGAGFTVTKTLHRAEADAVKGEVLSAGFVLDAESNVLANPSDDHTRRILDSEMHDKTDQFAFRFKKPANVANTDKRPKDDPLTNWYGNTFIFSLGDPTARYNFYHADHTYEEYGNTGTKVQQGTWYWDAAGHNCMIHQFPLQERGFIVCHTDAVKREVGPVTMWDNGGGPVKVQVVKGYVYPP
jgi:predicted methyltransferase